MILDIIKVIGGLADKLIPDPKAKQAFQVQLAELADRAASREHEQMLGQIETNKTEAQHRSIFVAGARPFIMWVCGVGVAMFYIVMPVVEMAQGKPVSISATELMVLLGQMLGFGALRSFDKKMGTSNDTPLGKPSLPAQASPLALPAPAEPPKKKRRFRL